MQNLELRACLLEVAEVLKSGDFKRANDGFLEAHCSKFDLVDENKLEYTRLHEQYVEVVEAILVQRLATKGLSMEPIESGLQDFVSQSLQPGTPEVENSIGEAVEFLISLSDFRTFKDMMLARKMELHKIAPAGTTVLITEAGMTKVRALLETAKRLMTLSTSSDDMWNVIVDNAEFKCEYSPKHNLYRGAALIDLPRDEALRMLMDFSAASTAWRPEMRDSRILRCVTNTGRLPGGISEDIIINVAINIPALLRWVAGFPQEITLRCAVDLQDDIFTWVTVGWDSVQDSEISGSLKMSKSGTIRAVGDGSKSMISFVQDVPAWLPNWLGGPIIRSQVLTRMKRQVAQYKDAVARAGAKG